MEINQRGIRRLRRNVVAEAPLFFLFHSIHASSFCTANQAFLSDLYDPSIPLFILLIILEDREREK